MVSDLPKRVFFFLETNLAFRFTETFRSHYAHYGGRIMGGGNYKIEKINLGLKI